MTEVTQYFLLVGAKVSRNSTSLELSSCGVGSLQSLSEHIHRLEGHFKQFQRSTRKASWVNEHYYTLNDTFGVLFRQQTFEPERLHTDCIPNFWLYAVNDFRGEIAYLRGQEEFQLWGPQAIFIPPFSIVNWRFKTNSMNWYAYEGTCPLPKVLPKDPICFPAEAEIFNNEAEIFRKVYNNKKQWRTIASLNEVSAVAVRVKKFVDEHFCDDLKVSHLAETLGYSEDVMTRQFKKMFRVTPSQYIRDLKYYQAALRIKESKESIKEIAEDVGVSNYENFSKVFRNIFKASPKKFRRNLHF